MPRRNGGVSAAAAAPAAANSSDDGGGVDAQLAQMEQLQLEDLGLGLDEAVGSSRVAPVRGEGGAALAQAASGIEAHKYADAYACTCAGVRVARGEAEAELRTGVVAKESRD